MPISRMDFLDAGSPEALVKRILQAEPNLSVPVPVQELCARLGISRIEDLDTDEFEGSIPPRLTRNRVIRSDVLNRPCSVTTPGRIAYAPAPWISSLHA